MQPTLTFLAVVVSVLLADSHGCSPMDHEPTFLQHVQHSGIILRGRVRRLVENPRDSTSVTKNYVAVVSVQCILKGDVTPTLVNVTNVGVTPGRCTRVDMEMDGEYLIMGLYYENAVRHNDHQSYPATQEVIQEASQACGLDPKYPTGVYPSTAQVKCPEVAGPDDCIPDQPAPGLQAPPAPDAEVLVDSEKPAAIGPSDDNSPEASKPVGDTEDGDGGEEKTEDDTSPVSAKQGGGSTVHACSWLLLLLTGAGIRP